MGSTRYVTPWLVDYQPRPEYGLVAPLLALVDGGVTARGGADWLVLTTPVALELDGSAARGTTTLRAGETVHLALHRTTLEQTPARVWAEDGLAATLEATVGAWKRTLSHLEGWKDSSPVRVGNGAWDQLQIDVYGELLGNFPQAFRHIGLVNAAYAISEAYRRATTGVV